jgi:DNA-binding NtrC family response regulator
VEIKILIVDDNRKLCQSLAQNFDQLGYTSYCALDSKSALYLLSKHDIGVVLLDMVLGDEDGTEVLQKLLARKSDLPVVMITGYGSIETAVKSVKIGAYDYVQKPLDFNKLLNIVENAIKMSELKDENRQLKDRIAELAGRIVSQNKVMLDLCEQAMRLAATDIPVLILGDNGTGKELLANFIHMNSKRSARKMNSINCAAFPETLLDNELFGHEKGAYTGADSTFIGIFEKADKGTLHLDEIGDMSTATQAKILRTLQDNEIRRIGGNKNIKIDMRFIASTNKDLNDLIKSGSFREDLFYRINAATLVIPPLRERMDDIPLLVDHLLKASSKANAEIVTGVSEQVLDMFMQYDWPGNVRELKNTINFSATMAKGEVIQLEDMPSSFMRMDQKKPKDPTFEETEKTLILNALEQSHNNKKQAAKQLKISRKTLYNKINKYGISLK